MAVDQSLNGAPPPKKNGEGGADLWGKEKTVTFIFLPFPLSPRPAGQWELLTAPGKKQLWPRGEKGREKDEDG